MEHFTDLALFITQPASHLLIVCMHKKRSHYLSKDLENVEQNFVISHPFAQHAPTITKEQNMSQHVVQSKQNKSQHICAVAKDTGIKKFGK